MKATQITSGLIPFLFCALAWSAEPTFASPGEKKRNNLVAELLRASSIAANAEFIFTRATEGWIFISANFNGTGTARSTLDPASRQDAVIVHGATMASVLKRCAT